MTATRINSRRRYALHPRRGSAMIMAIVVSVVVTSVVMVIAWNSATMVQSTSNYMKQARANGVAEGAYQRAYWLFKKDQTYRANPMTGTDVVDGLTYSYSVSVVGAANAPVLITATATTGSVQGQVHATLTMPSGTPPAAIDETGGNVQFSQAATVTGDLYGAGSISFHAGDTVTGNVTSVSTVSGGTISGTTTQHAGSVTVPTVASLYSAIQPTAHAIASGNISTLDFSSYSVLYASSNVTLQAGLTVIGSGTLIVNGDLSLNADIGAPGSPKTFSVVVSHDFNPSKNIYLAGSVYVEHDFNSSGTVVITGAIVGNHDIHFSGAATLTYAPPPSFDPRGGTLTQTTFGGANP